MSANQEFIRRAFDLYWERGEVEAFRGLQAEFKSVPRETLDDVLRRLKSLKDLAFELGNGVHDKHFEKEEAVKRLKANCPSFDDSIYEDAIGKGLFESMW